MPVHKELEEEFPDEEPGGCTGRPPNTVKKVDQVEGLMRSALASSTVVKSLQNAIFSSDMPTGESDALIFKLELDCKRARAEEARMRTKWDSMVSKYEAEISRLKKLLDEQGSKPEAEMSAMKEQHDAELAAQAAEQERRLQEGREREEGLQKRIKALSLELEQFERDHEGMNAEEMQRRIKEEREQFEKEAAAKVAAMEEFWKKKFEQELADKQLDYDTQIKRCTSEIMSLHDEIDKLKAKHVKSKEKWHQRFQSLGQDAMHDVLEARHDSQAALDEERATRQRIEEKAKQDLNELQKKLDFEIQNRRQHELLERAREATHAALVQKLRKEHSEALTREIASHKNDVAALEAQIQHLKEELLKSEASDSDLRECHEKYLAQVDQLNAQLRDARSLKEQMQARADKDRGDLERRLADLEDALSQEREGRKNDLEESEKKFKAHLEKDAKKAKEVEERLLNEKAEQDAAWAKKLEASQEKLHSRIAELEEQLAAAEEELARALAARAEDESALRRSFEERQAAALKTAEEALEEFKVKHNKQIQDREDQIADLQRQINWLKDQQKEELRKVQAKMDKAVREAQQKAQTTVKLHETAHRAQSMRLQEDQRKALAAEKDHYANMEASYEKQLAALRARLDEEESDASGQLLQRREEVDALQAEVRALQARLKSEVAEAQEAGRAALQEEKDTAKRMYDELRENDQMLLSQKDQELKNLHAEMDDTVGSREAELRALRNQFVTLKEELKNEKAESDAAWLRKLASIEEALRNANLEVERLTQAAKDELAEHDKNWNRRLEELDERRRAELQSAEETRAANVAAKQQQIDILQDQLQRLQQEAAAAATDALEAKKRELVKQRLALESQARFRETAHAAHLDKLRQRAVDELQAERDAHAKDTGSLEAQIGRLQAEITPLMAAKAKAGELADEIADLQARHAAEIEKLKADFFEQRQRLQDALQAQKDQAANDLDELSRSHKAQITELQAQQTDSEKALLDEMDSMRRDYENQLAQLRDKMATLTAECDAKWKATIDQARQDAELWHKRFNDLQAKLERGKSSTPVARGLDNKHDRIILRLFRMLVEEKYGHFTEEDLEKSFDRLDKDGSGSINKAEFGQVLKTLNKNKSFDMGMAFKKFDIHHNNQITGHEFQAVLSGKIKLHPEASAHIYYLVDQDRGGQISGHEFKQLFDDPRLNG